MSLAALQDRADNLIAQNTAGNSAVRVELEESITIDEAGNAIVDIREVVSTIPAMTGGSSVFVFPEVPAPDFGPDGGSASQFSYDEFVAALEPQGISVQEPLDISNSLDQMSFGEHEHETLAREIAGATSVFVNSEEQLEMVQDAIALLSEEETPLIVVQDDIEIPSELVAVAVGFGTLKAQNLQEEPEAEAASVNTEASVATDRSALLAELQASGELQQLEAYVETTTVGTPVPQQGPQIVFAGVTVPEADDGSISTEIENGEIIRVSMGDALSDILIADSDLTSEVEIPGVQVVARELPALEKPIQFEVREQQAQAGELPLENRLERLQAIANESLASYALEINDGELSPITEDAALARSWVANDLMNPEAEGTQTGTQRYSVAAEEESEDALIAERLQELARNLHQSGVTEGGTLVTMSQSLDQEAINAPTIELNGTRNLNTLDPSQQPTVELTNEQVQELTAGTRLTEQNPNEQPTIRLAAASVQATRNVATPKRQANPEQAIADGIDLIRGLASKAIEQGLQRLNNAPAVEMALPAGARRKAA